MGKYNFNAGWILGYIFECYLNSMIVGNIRECITARITNMRAINQNLIDFVTGIWGKDKSLAITFTNRYRATWRDTASTSC